MATGTSTRYIPSPTRWVTLAIVSLSTFMLALDLSVVSIALPQIHTALRASFSDLQWVYDAYALTLAVFLVTSGSLADRTGRKQLFQIGFAVFTAASLACGLSGGATALNFSRGVQGVGAAIMFAVGPALLGHEFRGKERALAFSAFGAAFGLAVASGPLIGGGLTTVLSWRWIFFLNVPIGIVALVVSMARIPESRDERARRVDWLGMAVFTLGLAALVFAIIRGNDDGWFSARIASLYAVSAVSFAAFLAVERSRGENAMFDLRFFRNPTFDGISLVALLANAGAIPSIFVAANYMENYLGNDAWVAGIKFLPLTISIFLAGAAAGILTGRVPFRLLMTVSCVMMAVGYTLTRLVGVDSTWTAQVASLVVAGIGMGMFNPIRAALVIGVAKPADAAVASGISESFQQVGVSLGIAAVGALFQNRVAAAFVNSPLGHQLGSAAHPAAAGISAGAINTVASSTGPLRPATLTQAHSAFIIGYHDAMTLSAGLCLAAALIALLLLRTRDLHSSTLSLVPPEILEPAAEPAAASI